MASRWFRGVVVSALAGGFGLAVACSSGSSSDHSTSAVSGHPNATTPPSNLSPEAGLADGGGGFASTPSIASVAVSPAQTVVQVAGGSTATQAFSLVATFSDKSTSALTTGVAWTVDNFTPGNISGTGVYTANGSLGGYVNVTGTYMGQMASAKVAVKLLLSDNPAMVSPGTLTALTSATAPDPAVVWAYPYSGTVFPRGLLAPDFMWNGGAAGDVYMVHASSATFDYQTFITPQSVQPNPAPSPQTTLPPAEYNMPQPNWDAFVNSTTGPATVTVSRFSSGTATLIATLNWTIAPASMRGTIYYWANNLGRIMRIKPGASAPDDFSAGVVPSPGNGCTMACHTVSADGSTMIATGGTYGGSYNLKTNAPQYALGGTPDSATIRAWALSAITPDGKYMVADQLGAQLTGVSVAGMFDTTAGALVDPTTSGLGSELYYMPAFSPDGSKLVFVGDSNPMGQFWAATGAPGDLKSFAYNESGTPMLSNEQTIMAAGSDPSTQTIAWPTVSPDGRWAIYSRMSWTDPSMNHNLTSYPPMMSDLYMADLNNPGNEVRLANLDGDGYPFAEGMRDLSLNFEPTLAPVAAGGYFWVVFLSRRTYGNMLTGDRTSEKQLWVAAINQNPAPGESPSGPPMDPSFAAFRLPGQDIGSLNLRGYWALDPCKGDGLGCGSGTECCGGYCQMQTTGADGGVSIDAAATTADASGGAVGDAGADAAPPTGMVCASQVTGCSQDGDKCNQSSDCCGASSGETCINHVCSVATPQ